MSRIWTPRQVKNLVAAHGEASWYRISNQAAGATEVTIYDSIGDWGIPASAFVQDLAAISGPINLHLNSEGGEVFDGLAIYNALKRRGDVTVFVDSLAASIASVIAQAGVKRVMARNATMMIHDASTVGMGNAQDLRTLADLLDKTSDNLASVYAERSGTDVEPWREAMRNTTWYNAEEAVAAGLADEVAGAAPTVKADASGALPFKMVGEHGPELDVDLGGAPVVPAATLQSAVLDANQGPDTTTVTVVDDAAHNDPTLDMAAISAALRSLKETE